MNTNDEPRDERDRDDSTQAGSEADRDPRPPYEPTPAPDTVVTASGERVPEPKDPLAESTAPHLETADQLDDRTGSTTEDQ